MSLQSNAQHAHRDCELVDRNPVWNPLNLNSAIGSAKAQSPQRKQRLDWPAPVTRQVNIALLATARNPSGSVCSPRFDRSFQAE